MNNPYNVKSLNGTNYMHERGIELATEDIFEWAHQLSLAEQIQIQDLIKGRNDLDEIIETLRYVDYEDLLLRHGLDSTTNQNFITIVIKMAEETEVPIPKLFQWIVLVGENYLKMNRLMSKPTNELDSIDKLTLRNSRLTRQIIETWPGYIYLGSLILREETISEL